MNSLFHRLTHRTHETVQRLHPYASYGSVQSQNPTEIRENTWGGNPESSLTPTLGKPHMAFDQPDTDTTSIFQENLKEPVSTSHVHSQAHLLPSSKKAISSPDTPQDKVGVPTHSRPPIPKLGSPKMPHSLSPLELNEQITFPRTTPLGEPQPETHDIFSSHTRPATQNALNDFKVRLLNTEPTSPSQRTAVLFSPPQLLPLNPQETRHRLTPIPPMRHEGKPQASASHTSPPEVHIHIGRIEVTAVGAPQSEKPARKPRANTSMSLEEYLKKQPRVGP